MVRIAKANTTQCPKLEDKQLCWNETNQFKLRVYCNETGPAKPMYVHVYNLGDEELLIYREFADQCDPLWEPVRCQGMQVTLSCNNPDIMLVVPGTYIFRTKSGDMLDNEDFAVEQTAMHKEYAELWLQQQALCCCMKGNHE